MPAPIRRLLCHATAVALALPGLAQSPAGVVDATTHRGDAAASLTIRDTSPNAFSLPSPGLSTLERRAFAVGNSFFKQNWVVAPASTTGRDGLGPLFNARSCSSCHLRDGRSAPPGPADVDRSGLLVRIGVRKAGGPDAPHPDYGGQIQDVAVPGVAAEARVAIDHEPVAGQYGDGTPFVLQRPSYTLHELAHGPLGEHAVLGPRTAPHLIGLGLLEAIPAATLAAWADPDDADGDGVSGRVAHLADGTIGRFGWKATQPTVLAQTAAAFVNDIGITSPLFPREVVTAAQRQRGVAVVEDEVEIDAATLARVVFYTQSLAVPAPRGHDDAAVQAGKVLFTMFGCATCHVPECSTGGTASHPAFASRRIAPFTDLLLHDLGPELADDKHDGAAGPREWRTPPLWGIGLIPTVNGHTRFLHDGRARGLAEAVLWHGGEALAARERFRLADATQRGQLLAFLQSL